MVIGSPSFEEEEDDAPGTWEDWCGGDDDCPDGAERKEVCVECGPAGVEIRGATPQDPGR
jgi:hypothetical protein